MLDWFDALVTWCLSLGPDGRHVLPLAGALVGSMAVAASWVVLAQRTPWRARQLVAALRSRLHTSEAGMQVSLVGRLRVPGKETVPSFIRAGRGVAVSSLLAGHERRVEAIITRAAVGLAIETRDGLVPIEGAIDIQRARGAVAARNVDAGVRARVPSASRLRATDLVDGQWVLAEGTVTHVSREGLREQGAVRGLTAGSGRVVLTALRPEVPPWTFTLAALGSLAIALLASPLPWPIPALLPVTSRPAWDLLTAARLLGPTRASTIARFSDSGLDPVARRWFAMANDEMGNCGPAVVAFAALRDDEAAIGVMDRHACDVEPALRVQLLRESGFAERALAASIGVPMPDRERRALDDEAGGETHYRSAPAEAPRAAPRDDDLVCDPACLEAIRGAGERALEIVEARMPARAGGASLEARVACSSSFDHQELLAELSLECGRFEPEDGVEAVRRAARPRVNEPLSRVEARLHVIRILLERGGDLEGARAVEARQRRILAILATPHGARAEARWLEPAAPTALGSIDRPRWRPQDGCNPFEGMTLEQIHEQVGF